MPTSKARALPVHPHACGEHVISPEMYERRLGSSPRMWGTPVRRVTGWQISWFIPTHVGNTMPCSSAGSWPTVHPHACGEHNTAGCASPCLIGSSPRMWGTPDDVIAYRLHRRFIPTHVGNTAKPKKLVSANSVHPHACGEHLPPHLLVQFPCGSSPRMWGTLSLSVWADRESRFIPTHVGNTYTIVQIASIHTVHPHACGEHSIFRRSLNCRIGSSPRMWGTRMLANVNIQEARFIPTHVGNTRRAMVGL